MSLIYHWYHWYHYQFWCLQRWGFSVFRDLKRWAILCFQDHAKTGCREGYEAPRHDLRMAQVCFQKRMEDQSIRHPMETLTFLDGNLKECQCLWHWPCGPKLCACAEKDCHGTVSKFNKVLSPSSHQLFFEFFNFEKVDFCALVFFAEKDLPLNLELLNWRGWSPTCRQLGPVRRNNFEEFRSNAETWCPLLHSPRCNRVPILQNRAMCRHPGPKRMRCGNPEFCGNKRWYEV